MDVECLKSVEQLLLEYPDKEFICGKMVSSIFFGIKSLVYKNFVNNGIILSSKSNPIVLNLIDENNIKLTYKKKWWYFNKEMYISNSISVDYFNYQINKSFLMILIKN